MLRKILAVGYFIIRSTSFTFSSIFVHFPISSYPEEGCAYRHTLNKRGEHPLLILNADLKFLLASCFCLAAFISMPKYVQSVSLNLKSDLVQKENSVHFFMQKNVSSLKLFKLH